MRPLNSIVKTDVWRILSNCGVLYYRDKLKQDKQKVTDCQLVEVFSSLHNTLYKNNTFWTRCPLLLDILIVSSFDWRLCIFYSMSKWLTALFLKRTDDVWQFNSCNYNVLEGVPVQLQNIRSATLTCILSYKRSNIHSWIFSIFMVFILPVLRL